MFKLYEKIPLLNCFVIKTVAKIKPSRGTNNLNSANIINKIT